MENEMSYSKKDIISLITNAGEYVGRFKDESPSEITITDPKMLISGENGVGFARSVSITAKEDITELTFNKAGVTFVTLSSDVIEKAFVSANSGIVV
tara:strand:+ start:1322 stop:1612 length:291 start_codon:yes stop_codon:yes gene_type:complete